MALIEMEGICRVYRSGGNRVEALRDVSLTVEEGDFLAVVGSSGSGKSTLMNLLGCLDRPDAGRYLLDGEDVSAMDEERLGRIRNRKIGFIFQGFHLIPTLNALENVELPLFYRGIPPAKRRGLAEAALARMGLSERLTHRPAQLSGGQQQRVAIARALAKRPKLLLCDEPTGALDYNTGKMILKLLQDTCREQGMTVVIVTHNTAITPMADRVIHMRNGEVTGVVRNPRPLPVEEIEW